MLGTNSIVSNRLLWLALSGSPAAVEAVLSGAATLAGDETDAFALDFTDDTWQATTGFYGSAYTVDTVTPANDYDSSPVTTASSLLTYTSPSVKSTLGPSGTYRYQAHNLCLHSESLADWTALASTVSGSEITFDNTVAAHLVRRTDVIPESISQKLRVSCVITAGSADYAIVVVSYAAGAAYWVNAIIDFNLGTVATYQGSAASGQGGDKGSATLTSLGAGQYRLEWVFTSLNQASTSFGFSVSADGTVPDTNFGRDANYAAGNVTYSVDQIHVSKYPADTTYLKTTTAARYDLPYEWNTSGVLRGIMVEPAATNLLTYSRTYSNGTWQKTRSTIAQDVTGIDGSTTGWTFTGDSSGGTSTAFLNSSAITVSTTTAYTFSVYAKAGTAGFIYLKTINFTTPGNVDTWFNLSTGAVGTTGSGHTAAISDVGNDWYRCSITFTTDAADTTGNVGFGIATSNGSLNITLDGSNTVLVDVAQLETGTVATSPIITYGATATRAADAASRAVTGYPHSATVNSGLVQFVPLNAATATAVIQLDDGTSNEVVSIGYDASANIGLTVTDGGAAQTAPLADGTVTATATETIGFSWKANDFLLSDNGATAVADTSGTLPTVTTLKIRASGGPILLRKLLLVPVEKTAAEVEAYGATS